MEGFLEEAFIWLSSDPFQNFTKKRRAQRLCPGRGKMNKEMDLPDLQGPLRRTAGAGAAKRPDRKNSRGDFPVLDNTVLRAS